MAFAGSSNNPFIFGELKRDDVPVNNVGYNDTSSKVRRDISINTAQKNLVLIVAGDSNTSGTGPTRYTPSNASVIDNFNVYDGADYACADPLLGCALGGVGDGGNYGGRLADLLINNGIFARVILVPLGIGGSNVGHWVAGGMFYNKIPAAMARLAERGITPATAGVTFALIYMTGANDHGITALDYATGYVQVVNKAKNAGFVGRVFVPKYSILTGSADSGVTTGQANLIDNVTYFFGGDLDALPNSPNRQVDNTHFTATGQANIASAIYAAMHASGSPF